MSRRFITNLLMILPLALAVSFGLSLWQSGGAILHNGWSINSLFNASPALAQTSDCVDPVVSPTDPSNGRIYYNKSCGKFRMYVRNPSNPAQGVWDDLGTSLWSKGGSAGSEYLYPTDVDHAITLGYPGSPAPTGVYPPSLGAAKNLFYGVVIDPLSSDSGPAEHSDASANLVLFDTATWSSGTSYGYDKVFAVTVSGQAQAKDFCILQADGNCPSIAAGSLWREEERERNLLSGTAEYISLIPANEPRSVEVIGEGLLATPKLCVPNADEENCISSLSELTASSNLWGYLDINETSTSIVNKNKIGGETIGDVTITRDLKVGRDINVPGSTLVTTHPLAIQEESRDLMEAAMDSSGQKMLAIFDKLFAIFSDDGGVSWTVREVWKEGDSIYAKSFRNVWISPDGGFAMISGGSGHYYYSTDAEFKTWTHVELKKPGTVQDLIADDITGTNTYVLIIEGSRVWRFLKTTKALDGTVPVATLAKNYQMGWVTPDGNHLILGSGLASATCELSGGTYDCDEITWPPTLGGTKSLDGRRMGSVTGATSGGTSKIVLVGNTSEYYVSTNYFGDYAHNDTDESTYVYGSSLKNDGLIIATAGSKSVQVINFSAFGSTTFPYDINEYKFDFYSNAVLAGKDHVIVFGDNGTIAVSPYPAGADTWLISQISTVSMYGVWGDSSKFIVVGSKGTVARAANTPTLGVWTFDTNTATVIPNITYRAVSGAASGANCIIAVGDGSSGAKSTDGGFEWVETSGLNSKNYGVWVKASNTAWVVGNDSLIKTTTNCGGAWVTVNPGVSLGSGESYKAINGLTSGTKTALVAVTNKGKIVGTIDVDDITKWKSRTDLINKSFAGVWIASFDGSSAYAIAVGEDNIMYKITVTSSDVTYNSLQPATLPYYWTSGFGISGNTTNLLRVVGLSGKIMECTDTGVLRCDTTGDWNATEKSSVDPQLNGVYKIDDHTMVVGNNNTVLLFHDGTMIGGNITVGNNIWGGSGGTASTNPAETAITPPNFTSCPSGQFMVGVKINSGLVQGLYCQKL